jgi:hypothetical protein
MNMAKAKVVGKPRVTLAAKLHNARMDGYAVGTWEGRNNRSKDFEPAPHLLSALSDFVVAIEGWRLDDTGVVLINGTDLKKFANMGLPTKTMVAIAGELRRLGYGK